MFRRILVPVDGSRTSNQGLKEAVQLAHDQRARLRMIHVVDEYVITQNVEGFVNAGDLIDALRDAGKKAIAAALAFARKHRVKADSALYESMGGRVADVIVREARKWRADLIVMGTHGRRGVGRVVLGSDAEAVLHETPVPVLMVRAPGKRRR